MKNDILTTFNRGLRVSGLLIKKHSPKILAATAAAGTVGGCILACKATLKLEETIDQCKDRKAEIEANKGLLEASEYKKEIAKVTVKNAFEVGKLYSKAAAVELATIASIGVLLGIEETRNKRLAAACATWSTILNNYRKNVIDTFGEEVDRDMRFGIKHEKVETTVEDPETGKKKKVKEDVAVVDYDPNDPNYISEYSRFYDSSVFGWDKNPEVNRRQLIGMQGYANNLLVARGYLFLNDVYKIIGFEPSIAGQCVGWVYDPDNPKGDNYIDFGITHARNANRRFVNGLEPVVLLDFNVDGDILNDPKLNKLLKKRIDNK